MRFRAWRVLAVLTVGLWPLASVAGDGRIEINQIAVQAAGGFPFTLAQPGSYVLTSDLIVSADVDGLVVAASDVSLDLNGFRIDGPGSCSLLSCPTGTSRGVGVASPLVGQRVSVHSGTVTGFSGTCVDLSAGAHVSDLMIQSCGGAGIEVGVASAVLGNRVLSVGLEGLKLSRTTVFGHNVIRGHASASAGARAISGGSPSAGNLCEDDSCAPGGRRRFYLTQASFNGSQADASSNCEVGFHFASIWEILSVSDFTYATKLGHTQPDSGSGPPSQAGGSGGSRGWIRTGQGSRSNIIANGYSNCSAWSNSLSTSHGLTAKLNPRESVGSLTILGPWALQDVPCNAPLPVWCVED